nr:26S proteasome non-ATPase regulatory subunit 12 homolog A-like [Tanacetum cinerariifolium]
MYKAVSPAHQLAVAKEIVRHLILGVIMYPLSTFLGDHKDNFVAALIEKADCFVGVFPGNHVLLNNLSATRKCWIKNVNMCAMCKAAEDLKERVIEHNILVVSMYYERITVKRLAELLCLIVE